MVVLSAGGLGCRWFSLTIFWAAGGFACRWVELVLWQLVFFPRAFGCWCIWLLVMVLAVCRSGYWRFELPVALTGVFWLLLLLLWDAGGLVCL